MNFFINLCTLVASAFFLPLPRVPFPPPYIAHSAEAYSDAKTRRTPLPLPSAPLSMGCPTAPLPLFFRCRPRRAVPHSFCVRLSVESGTAIPREGSGSPPGALQAPLARGHTMYVLAGLSVESGTAIPREGSGSPPGALQAPLARGHTMYVLAAPSVCTAE